MSEAVVDKAVRRLEEAVAKGSAYEGLQSAKSVYHRCRSRRQYNASYDLAQRGAGVLLQHGDVTAGMELAKMLVEGYVSDGVPALRAATQRVISILNAAQALVTAHLAAADLSKPFPAEAACQQLTLAAVKWAKGQDGGVQEAQHLHQHMGQLIWNCRGWHGLGMAAQHFSRGDDLTAYAAVLAACSAELDAESGEESWLLLRAGLHVLLASKPSPRDLRTDADLAVGPGLERVAQLLKAYCDITGRELPQTAQVHLLLVLIKAVKHQNSRLVGCMEAVYEPWLKSDPELHEAAALVESAYLLSKQATAGGGLLSDLFQMLGNG